MGKQLFNLKGMMRDLDVSKGNSQYAYEIRNLRLTAQEDSTLLALTTEKGNIQFTLKDETGNKPFNIRGKIVGYCTVGTKYIVLFTHSSSSRYGDSIYRLEESTGNVMLCKELYGSTIDSAKDLGFTDNTVIEAIGVYENEDIQKAYWIDGVNQPRVINIMADATTITAWNNNDICPFDFMLKMKLEEDVTVEKLTDTYGVFSAGTIQYVLAYHTEMGQQTPSFYVSPIYYVSPENKGASAESSVNTAFKITINNIDSNFNYIDIYSVQRTSEDGTPVCKKITELKIKGNTEYCIDNGLNAELVDYSEILYLGGTNIVPYTMEQKNNVLFFGNVKYSTEYITEAQKTAIFNGTIVSFIQGDLVEKGANGSFYIYKNQLGKSQAEISTFMSDESYYIGIILQDEYGVWSDVIPVGGNNSNHRYYERHHNTNRINDTDTSFNPVNVKVQFNNQALQLISNYKRIKIVRLRETPSVVCQGVVAPTVYNKRRKDGIYAQSSWFFRPINTQDSNGSAANLPQWRHNASLRTSLDVYNGRNYSKGEIVGATKSILIAPPKSWKNDFSENEFFIDWNLITMHSPEIEFGNVQNGNFDFYIIGDAVVDKSAEYVYLTLSKPTRAGRGLTQRQELVTSNAGKVLLGPLWYEDTYASLNSDGTQEWKQTALYPLYTWSRDIITTQREGTDALQYSTIDTKCMSSLRTATKNTYVNDLIFIPTSSIYIYQEDEQPVVIQRDTNNPDYLTDAIYKGASNDILVPYGYPVGGITEGEAKFETSGSVIPLQYKSTKHAVMQLLYDIAGSPEDNKQCVMPNTLNTSELLYQKLFWSDRNKSQPTIYSNTRYIAAWAFVVNLKLSEFPNAIYKGIAIRKEEAHKFSVLNSGDYVYIDSEDTNTIKCYRINSSQITTYDVPVSSFLWVVVSGDSRWYIDSSNTAENSSLFYYLRPAHPSTETIFYVEENIIGKKLTEINGSTYCIWGEQDSPGGSLSRERYPTYNYENNGSEKTPFDLFKAESYTTAHNNYVYLTSLKAQQQELKSFVNTSWIVAGVSTKIDNSVNYIGTIGDAYYQRFDCLKTYPYSIEDVNQVVEIMSFMCETRINIDGRYDTKRGLVDNTIVTGENFNLLNKGYTQEDNIFSSSFLDAEDFSVDNFPNQIIWTRPKTYGSSVDNWTHVVATSTLDMDGTKGSITSLKLWNDKLLCLQEKGLAIIKYNENVAISSTLGVPIELANSNKVEGKSYISDSIGCSNKESIQITPDGLYFADGNTREIYKYREGLQSLSKGKGFNTYFYDSNVDFTKIKTFYDAKLKDVYFRIERRTGSVPVVPDRGDIPQKTTTECLIYNEQLEEFTSFIDYDMQFLFSVKDSLIAIRNNALWKQFQGNYLNLFGVNHEYSIDLLCSENPVMDKTFTNIEFRADVFNGDTLVNTGNTLTTANALPFTHIKVWNEYQTTADTAFTLGIGSGNLSQKFRIWRGDIPRSSNNFLERIRNTWTRVKLWKTADNNHYKTVIHDVAVSYV